MSICSCCCFLWPPAEENQKEVMKVLYCGGTHGTNSQYWWVVTGLSPPMGRPSLVVTRGETQKAASVASMLLLICSQHALIFGQCSLKDLRWRIITAVLSQIQNTFNFKHFCVNFLGQKVRLCWSCPCKYLHFLYIWTREGGGGEGGSPPSPPPLSAWGWGGQGKEGGKGQPQLVNWQIVHNSERFSFVIDKLLTCAHNYLYKSVAKISIVM